MTPPAWREKYRTARAAQANWRAVPLAQRRKAIARFRDLLASEANRLAATLTSETGKPISQARREIEGVRERIDFFLANVAAVLRPQVVREDRPSGLTEKITHEPLGVIANISAWNYPYFVGGNVFVPALLARQHGSLQAIGMGHPFRFGHGAIAP